MKSPRLFIGLILSACLPLVAQGETQAQPASPSSATPLTVPPTLPPEPAPQLPPVPEPIIPPNITVEPPSLVLQLRQAQDALQTAKEEIETLRVQLKKTTPPPPDYITAQRVWLTDDVVAFRAKTNRPGDVRAKLFLKGGSAPIEMKKSVANKDHLFKFTINRGQDYEVRLAIMDGGKERSILGPDKEDALIFTSPEDIAAPKIIVHNIPFSDHVEVRVTSTEPVLLHLACYRRAPDGTGEEKIDEKGGEIKYDGTGKPEGGVPLVANQEQIFTFLNLIPEKKYVIRWQALGAATGKKALDPDPKEGFPEFTTPRVFSFSEADGLTVVLSPSALTVSWSATDEPDSAALWLFTTAGSLKAVATKAVIQANRISFSVPLEQINGVILPADPRELVKAPPLRIKATMKRGLMDSEASVAVAFEIPGRESKQLIADKDKQDAIDSFSHAMSKNQGRIDWSELVKIGLPLILRVAGAL